MTVIQIQMKKKILSNLVFCLKLSLRNKCHIEIRGMWNDTVILVYNLVYQSY